MSQANAAPITGDTILAPDMSAGNIADASPSRRAFFAGVLLAPVAIASPVIAHPSIWKLANPAGAGGGWKAALARYRAIDAAWDQFLATEYNPAIAELDRRAIAPPPGFTITAKSGREVFYLHDPANPEMWSGSPIPQISAEAMRGRMCEQNYTIILPTFPKLSF